MEGILVPIALFLMIFAILYVYYTTRAKERVALTEKGVDSSIYNIENSKYHLLKWGISLITLSIGIISGYALSYVINEVAAYFTSVLLFGGLGLMVAYFVTNSISKNEK